MSTRLLILCAVILCIGCKKSSTQQSASLSGSWRLVLIENTATGSSVSKDQTDADQLCRRILGCDVVLEFREEGGQNVLSGHTITNIIFGRFDTTDGNGLNLELGITKVSDSEWSQYLSENASHINRYEISVSTLRLYADSRNTRLIFIRQRY